MEKKYYWMIWGVIGVALFIIALASHDYFYEMKTTNCESVLSNDYDVSTEDVVSCKKFNNYPFWEFDSLYWFLFGFFHIASGGILVFIKEVFDDDDSYW